MIRRQNERSERGQSRTQLGVILVLGAITYYGYQYLAIYQAPRSQLLNKDFVCGRGAFSTSRKAYTMCVFGSQDRKTLVEYVRASNLKGRLQAPDKAIENENIRNQLLFQHSFVNLADARYGDPMSEMYNPLVVHVLEVDNTAQDVPILLVRPLNKRHKDETWYIAATDINPGANVTGFGETVAKIHKPGLLDVIENKDVQKAAKALMK